MSLTTRILLSKIRILLSVAANSLEQRTSRAIRRGWVIPARYLSLWLAVGSAEQRLLKPTAVAIRPARTFSKCRNDGIGSELPLKAYLGPCLVGRSWR